MLKTLPGDYRPKLPALQDLAAHGGSPSPCSHTQTVPLALQEHHQPFLFKTNLHHIPRTRAACVCMPSMGCPAQGTLILADRRTELLQNPPP